MECRIEFTDSSRPSVYVENIQDVSVWDGNIRIVTTDGERFKFPQSEVSYFYIWNPADGF